MVSLIVSMGRMGQPEEIAATVVFLCSDAANYITGQPKRDRWWIYRELIKTHKLAACERNVEQCTPNHQIKPVKENYRHDYYSNNRNNY